MKKNILIIFAICCLFIFISAIVFNILLFPKKYKNYVVLYSNEYNLELQLVYAIIKTESDFDCNAVSHSGAIGLMQLMPKTASWIASELGINFRNNDLFNPEINIRFGCYYLKYLFDKFEKRDIVICAYNAGETKVLDWINEFGELDEIKIDYSETRNYLKKVKQYYNIYKNNNIYF